MPVMNRHTDREFIEEDAVSITRPGPWGNPFVIGRDGDREAVISRYRSWLWERIRSGSIRLEDIAAFHGRQLICVCKPLPCHGDVLVAAAAWAAGEGGADRNRLGSDRWLEVPERPSTTP